MLCTPAPAVCSALRTVVEGLLLAEHSVVPADATLDVRLREARLVGCLQMPQGSKSGPA